jgi:hypothetical protein
MMQSFSRAHVLVGEPVTASPEHEFCVAHVPVSEPVTTSQEHEF